MITCTDSPPGDHLYKLGLRAYENKDYMEALKNWKEAAEQGSAAAYCDIGWMYNRGLGVEQNDQLAFKAMLTSAQMGYPRAQVHSFIQ